MIYWKCLATLCFIVNVNVIVATEYKEKYFEQVLDHFNFVSFGNRTYKQRYLLNDSWWIPGKGPIFFYTGNEGNIESFWNNTGFVFDIAPKFNALVIFAEHRYYGASLPFGKASFKRQNLGLLTIEQAMADYAVLIESLKETLDASSCPVIVFGGSYGGMLSAYMRFKYPNLVHGAIASSAPILQTAGLVSTAKFFEAVTKDFNDVSPKCREVVENAYSELGNWASQGQSGYKKITRTFSLCNEIVDHVDYDHFIKWTRIAFVNAAMMDYPYRTSFVNPYPPYPVKAMCNQLMSTANAPQGLSSAVSLTYNSSGTLKCFDIWKEFVDCADPTGCGTGTDSTAWDYQCCTEVNLYYNTKSKEDMFPLPPFTSAMREKYCKEKYGVVPRKDWLKIQLWGKDIQQSSNIVFSNGDLDPWAVGGVLYNVSNTVVSVIVKGGAHHLDLRGRNSADPPSVQHVRELEELMIKKWIKEAAYLNKNCLSPNSVQNYFYTNNMHQS